MDDSTLLNLFSSPSPPPLASDAPGVLKGPGGGIDDLIPAAIHAPDGPQPAALSPGEYVLPAAVLAFLGDGNNDFGGEMLDFAKGNPELLSQIRELIRSHMGSKE